MWPNLARVIDLQEFMGRRPITPQRAVVGSCRCQLFVGRSPGKSARGGCRLMGSRLPPRTSPDWALLGANFRRSWCDLEPRAWIGISCNGLRRLSARDLPYNALSTARRQPGILMHVHPVLPWNLKLQQPQLSRSETDGQPTESSQLARLGRVLINLEAPGSSGLMSACRPIAA